MSKQEKSLITVALITATHGRQPLAGDKNFRCIKEDEVSDNRILTLKFNGFIFTETDTDKQNSGISEDKSNFRLLTLQT